MRRVVVCDFCSIPLGDTAWDFPARDVDYDEPRIGPNTPEPVEGAVGSWLACPPCARLIRAGERDKLAQRSMRRLESCHPEWVQVGRRAALASIREVQDRFWAARRGEATEIGAEQLALVADDAPFIRSPREER